MILHHCLCGGQVEAGGKAPPGGGECLACGKVYESGAAVQAAGGSSAIICDRRRSRRPQRCSVEGCTHDSVALCDEPTGPRRTCDKAMCSAHRTMVGKNRDRCPAHAPHRMLVP